MRTRRYLLFTFIIVGILIVVAFILNGVDALSGNNPNVNNNMEKLHSKQLYQCPMHPSYTSDKPGQCPICGMNLVRIEKDKSTNNNTKTKDLEKSDEIKQELKHQEHKHGTKESQQLYQCPMHPSYTSDKPGQCPICGMNLVRIEKDKMPAKESELNDRVMIKISPEKQQIIGIKNAKISKQILKKTIRAVGIVDYKEPNLYYINTKFEGWIEKLYVDYEGRYVKKGEKLVDIYSPDLVSAQQEYLLALKYEDTNKIGEVKNNLSVLDIIREKFKLWDITSDQIEMLKKTGIVKKLISLYSPINGFVIEKKAIGGQRIMPGENIYKIADLSTVWIVGDVYQKDLAWVRINQPVRIIISYIPGEEFQGTISFIYPYLNETTGTNKVRIEVQNKGYKLKPGMYANLEFTLSIGEKLVIPSEAVLDSGEVKYAFLDKGNGFFEPKIIKVGISGDDYYEIISGLKEGDKVITDAAFLIDSESSIKAAISQMMNGEHKH